MGEILIVVLGIIFGVLPTLYLLWEFCATMAMKIYRKVKYGISLFD